MKNLLISATLGSLFISFAASSQSFSNTDKSYSSLGSITPAQDFFYFTLNEEEHGLELWRSDGSTSGTALLADINPGSASSAPGKFHLIGDLLFFLADDGTHGQELWRSDGTANGTFMVADILPGPMSASITFLSSTSEKLFFHVEDFTQENELVLWQSDGTTTGTFVVDVDESNPAAAPLTGIRMIPSTGQTKVVMNSKIYFVGDGTRKGEELWCQEGRRPSLVKDINPGKEKSFIMCLTVIENTLYFSATDGIHGSELWKSDGSREGTVMLLDIFPGPHSSVPRNITAFNGKVYFSVFAKNGIELWTTDGTGAGTKKVFPGPSASQQKKRDLLTSTFPALVD